VRRSKLQAVELQALDRLIEPEPLFLHRVGVAAATMGLVFDAMRKMVSRRMRGWLPNARTRVSSQSDPQRAVTPRHATSGAR